MDRWWNRLALGELNRRQWEALCDGCARCCLHKLEDADTGELFFTAVHCRNLDLDKCRCSDYPNRLEQVPDCVQLHPDNVGDLQWLPPTCAYRLRSEGRSLPAWHPLESGDPGSVHQAQISVRGRAISEDFVHPDSYDEHILRWVDEESSCA